MGDGVVQEGNTGLVTDIYISQDLLLFSLLISGDQGFSVSISYAVAFVAAENCYLKCAFFFREDDFISYSPERYRTTRYDTAPFMMSSLSSSLISVGFIQVKSTSSTSSTKSHTANTPNTRMTKALVTRSTLSFTRPLS